MVKNWGHVDINGLLELEDLETKFQCEMIIHFGSQTIEIYNDYRE